MGSAKRSDTIKNIFGKIPVAGAMELISQADGALQNYENMIKDAAGTVNKVSQTMTDNLAGDIKGLQSAQEALGISVYDTVSGQLRELAQSFTGVLRKANDWGKN
ncbi:phage tail tape measure protein, TP901 family, core region [Pasteurella bettyae]|nr:phage tail tape measure protein, TP901 family, core region [Pasteurella bettyae]